MSIDISDKWEFVKEFCPDLWFGMTGTPSDPVSLPHSWNFHDTFQQGIKYYQSWGSYRKSIILPDDTNGKAVFLRSEGFYGTGELLVNGDTVAEFDGQYLGICIDIGKHLMKNSGNIIGFRLNNKYSRKVLPGIRHPDFLLYGGLCGRVWLEILPEIHINRDGFFASSANRTDSADIDINFEINNLSGRSSVLTAVCSICDGTGRICAESSADISVPVNGLISSSRLTLDAPRLWSPGDPFLYIAKLTIKDGSSELDSIEQKIGIRTAEFRKNDGLYLNGKKIHLHGCNRHESMPGFGQALPAGLQRKDAELIKETGLNFVRLSHYPQHTEFLNACDELGLLVYAEIATWKSVRGHGSWLESACRQMTGMIRRDRHHPSVIIWGMGNESQSRNAYLKLKDIANRLDPSRPVTYAENHMYRARRYNTTDIPDVWGCNYEFDAMKDGIEASRSKCLIVTECSNYPPGLRGNLAEELNQVELIKSDIAKMGDPAGNAGFALWCFNDYATIRKDRYFRFCGIMDAWRMPKLSANYLQALYLDEPFIKIAGDWSLLSEEKQRRLHIFTNCESVEIKRGTDVLCKLAGSHHMTTDADFKDAQITATGTRDGKAVSSSIQPYGNAFKLMITPEEKRGATIGFTVEVQDLYENRVLDWNGMIDVSVSGSAFFRSWTGKNEIGIYGGIGRGFISLTGTNNKPVITVSGSGFKTETCSIPGV